jgi:DNA repair protein RecO (recombination protein O)
MDWQDEGLVIGVRRHGETSVILELMTRAHGRHLGLVRGGRSRAMRSVLQPGNHLVANWRARLEDQLGNYAVEPIVSRAARLLDRGAALHGVAALSALLRLLPERDPHEELYELADAIAEGLAGAGGAGALIEGTLMEGALMTGALMARFELALLGALGFGLDLDACALTGAREDLAYVSPKSGRAVSREAGAPWRERLLPYPDFLQDETVDPGAEDIAAAFRLTGHFLTRDVLTPRGAAQPPSRALYIAAVAAR